MGQRPAYTKPTCPVGVRMPESTRRILEYLTVTTGAPSLSTYLRWVYEQHLRSLGFELTDGVDAAFGPPPTREQIAAWQARGADGRQPDRTVG